MTQGFQPISRPIRKSKGAGSSQPLASRQNQCCPPPADLPDVMASFEGWEVRPQTPSERRLLGKPGEQQSNLFELARASASKKNDDTKEVSRLRQPRAHKRVAASTTSDLDEALPCTTLIVDTAWR